MSALGEAIGVKLPGVPSRVTIGPLAACAAPGRKTIVERKLVPDAAVGLIEDAVALGVAFRLGAAARRGPE